MWLGWSRRYGPPVAQAYPYCFRRVKDPVRADVQDRLSRSRRVRARSPAKTSPVRSVLVAARANSTPIPGAFDLTEVQPANFGRRFGALLIDWALCLLVASFYADPRVVAWPPVAVLIVLNTVCIGLFGRTPGMALAGLRCISIADGGAIGLPRALLRAVLLALLIPAVILDANRRGLHDRAAGSMVVLNRPRAGVTGGAAA
jgi:uncharacterized RDD family membrane protein YckC